MFTSLILLFLAGAQVNSTDYNHTSPPVISLRDLGQGIT